MKHDKRYLLAEIEDIIKTTPPRATLRHRDNQENLNWFGRVSAFIEKWSPSKSTTAKEYIELFFSNRLAREAASGLTSLQILLNQAKTELQTKTEDAQTVVTGRLASDMNTKRVLNVMIASPGDVATERKAVRSTIDKLNRVLADRLGFMIQLRSWETDVYPSFHPEGPQGLIDSKLHIEDHDAVIVVMWCRFGTPTHESQSGTEHEFKRAFKAWRENGSPQIICYFNTAPCHPKTKEDAEQLGRIFQFKKEFPQPGMWGEYNGADEFERVIDDHLTGFLLDHWERDRSQLKPVAELPKQPGFLPAALLALQQPLRDHLELLFHMYKASVSIRTPHTFGSVRAFLTSPALPQELRFLDFSTAAPVSPPMSWGDWASSQHRKLEDSLNRAMDRYAHSLTPELAYSLEQLSKSGLIPFFRGMAGVFASGGRGQVHPCWLSNAAFDIVTKDASILATVIDKYNNAADPAQQIVLQEDQLWRIDVAPAVGSGRFSGPIPN